MEELIAKAARLLIKCRYAIALTGAGMSTESGIPDFRGPNGIWTKTPTPKDRPIRVITSSSKTPENTGSSE